MSDRFIGVNELYRQLTECWNTNDTDKGRLIQSVIDRVVTPIVSGIPEMICRCENCQFVHFNKDSCTYHCKRRGYFSEEVKPRDFCSYGQRKDT